MENLPLNTIILVTLLRCLLAFNLACHQIHSLCSVTFRSGKVSTTSRWNPERVTIHMKANEYTFLWYCLLLSRIHTFKVTLNFKSVDEIRKFDHYKVSLFLKWQRAPCVTTSYHESHKIKPHHYFSIWSLGDLRWEVLTVRALNLFNNSK